MIKLFLTLNLLILACSASPDATVNDYTPVDHSSWNALLQKHVTPEGAVNYKGIIEDKDAFENYLQLLSNNPPDKKTWSEDEQLAYWINAYNAYTVKLILNHYPVKRIKDIKNGIPFINSVWDINFFSIGGEKMSLNNIEHGIIRKEFDEPRIHFAVVCAAYSCPRLRNEAYTAERLNEQLDEQTKVFLADTRKNDLSNPNTITISKIFKWYSTDFTKAGAFSRLFGGKNRTTNLTKYIAPYTDTPITNKTKVKFMKYHWALNEQ